MGLKDVTGVFSRYFIVGFFLPSYFALVAIYELAPGIFGDSFVGLKRGSTLLVLGGAGLLLGLLLTGLADQDPLPPRALWAFYRGWRGTALKRFKRWYRALRGGQSKKRRVLTMRPTSLSKMAWRCDDEIFLRWGLVWRPVWTRVEFLLTDVERALHVDAETDVAFLVNSSLAAAVVTAFVFINQFPPWGEPSEHWRTAGEWGWWWLILLVVGPILARILYVFAHRAADGVAVLRIASIDVHRHDLYERLGLGKPKTTLQEKRAAKELNELLHWATLPDVHEIEFSKIVRGQVQVLVRGSYFDLDYRAYVVTMEGRPVTAKTHYVDPSTVRVTFHARHVQEAAAVRIAIFRPDPGGGSEFQEFGPVDVPKEEKPRIRKRRSRRSSSSAAGSAQ